MNWMSISLTVLGLCFFEVISSLDNAVVNADVLATMQAKWRKWFLLWGIIFAVFVVRGFLPILIVWFSIPDMGFFDAVKAMFRDDPAITAAIKESSPMLLVAGGLFLVLLFLHWLFLEEKNFGLSMEKIFDKNGAWFYALASLVLTVVIWKALKMDGKVAFAASIGSSVFFIVHGLKEHAQRIEADLTQNSNMSDLSKLIYLEVLDATFSIDGVVGAFAFTMSIPLILIGNGIGAIVVRELTIRGVDRIRNYPYLKNGAMYSIAFLGSIMLLHGFGVHVPEYAAPLITMVIIGFFFWKSVKAARS